MKERRVSHYFLPVADEAMQARVWDRVGERLAAADRWRRPLRALAFAAVITGVACLAWVGASLRGWQTPSVAGVQVVELADGSRMELTADDKAVVTTVTPERVEVDVQSGSPLFRVAKNPARTFVARAAGHTITVVGTVFVVQVTATGLEVLVDEGVVEVGRDDGDDRWRIHAGERWSSTRRDSPSAQTEGPSGAAAPPPSPDPDGTAAAGAGPPPAPSASPEGGEPERGEATGPPRARAAAGTASGPAPDDAPAAAALFQRAQEARLAGRSEEAARLLAEFLDRYPRDQRAGIVAFELGRIRLDSMDDPKGALDALQRAQGASAAFDEQVAARRVQALEQSGEMEKCRAARAEFLGKYPDGAFAAIVQQRCR
jgi:TolA-binding protein